MSAYPISGVLRLWEIQDIAKRHTGEELSLGQIFRYVQDRRLELVLFMNDAAADSFYYEGPEIDWDIDEEQLEVRDSASWRFADVPVIHNEYFLEEIIRHCLIEDYDTAHDFLPYVVQCDTHIYYWFENEISPKKSIKLGSIEERFGITGKSFELFLAQCRPQAQSLPKPSKKLSIQGENSYKRSCRALAQALIGTLPDIPTAADIRELEKELSSRGTENPNSAKTWIKHLSQPD